jgi:hypothetical protein
LRIRKPVKICKHGKVGIYTEGQTKLLRRISRGNALIKILGGMTFTLLTMQAKSQTEKDYITILTAERRQRWSLDSVTLNSNYTQFKKEMNVLFKLNNQAILSYGGSSKTDTVGWYLEKKEKYFLLRLGEIGQYEIDFLQKNNLRYMRWRNEITLQKNINITEYFFIPSKL